MKTEPSRLMPRILLAMSLIMPLLIGGCGQKEEAAPTAEAMQELKDAKDRALKAEQARDKAESEKQQALKDNQLKDQQLKEIADAARTNERLVWILGVFVVISLFIGIGIGSSARKKSLSQDTGSE